MSYQKVYMNQIHSSSLLCQLSHMWKTQMLCDAIIKTGQIITKAHRVVLVAACPMLQSMENASAGSHLEVRLAADIKQESVNTFLQYLYEGFMMLTEENCRDVEKVARLLQVDSVIKCCADFYKCMNSKTGAPFPGSSYKYTFSGHDLAEFRHVRATELQKTAHERMMKRVSDFPRPGSPGSKRQRLHRGGSPDVTVIESDKADDTASMTHSYMTASDPWDRVPRLGSGMGPKGASGKNSQPGVIEIVEESIELVQTEPPEKTSGQSSSSRPPQKSSAVSIAVASQFNTEPEISVVNVFGNPDSSTAPTTVTNSSSSRGSITVSPLTIFQDPRPPPSSSTSDPSLSASESTINADQQRLPELQLSGISHRADSDNTYSGGKQQKSSESHLTSTPQQRLFPMSISPANQSKPFAAGSAMQVGMASPSSMSLPVGSPSSSKSSKPRSAPASPAERGRDNRNRQSEAVGVSSTADMTPDLSIVKIESGNHETGGLDMHVDMPEEGVMQIQPGRIPPDDQEDLSDREIEDWAREEMSNEGSNVSGDQNNSWYMGTFKGEFRGTPMLPLQTRLKTSEMDSFNSSSYGNQSTADMINRQVTLVNEKIFSLEEINMPHIKIFSCRICGLSYGEKDSLIQHMKSEHGSQYSHFCFECGKGFKAYSGLYDHDKSNHAASQNLPTCHVCGKYFARNSRLLVHMRKHSQARPFVCQKCGKSYKHRQNLKEHICYTGQVL